MKLSVVILTRNCVQTISRCIRSVSEIADEIILVDESSSDGTLERAAEFSKVRVSPYHMADFSDGRNHGISQCSGEWILMLDSDEYLSDGLLCEISHVIREPCFKAYDFRRIHIFLGKPIRYCDYNTYTSMPRLFKKGCGQFVKPVHEELDYKGEIGLLSEYCYHDNARDLYRFVLKIVRYSNIEAQGLAQEGTMRKPGWSMIIHRPVKEFFKRYVRKQGFRDGTRGFVLSVLESLSCFLILVFYWDIIRKERKI